jgi:uncharacterized FlgJ-related protein
MKMYSNSNQGFVALITIVIISSIIVITMAAVASTAYNLQKAITIEQSSKNIKLWAEHCTLVAALDLNNGYNFNVSKQIVFNNQVCEIFDIPPPQNNWATIRVKAETQLVSIVLESLVQLQPLKIISQQQLYE